MVKRIVKDIKHRLSGNPAKIILPILIVIILLTRENLNIKHLTEMGFKGKPSVGDLFVSLFWGMQTYIPDDMSLFQLPYDWLIVMIGFAYASADLVTKELETNGIAMILQSGRRGTWIINRYIVGISISLLLFAGVIMLCIAGAGMSKGTVEFGITEYTEHIKYVYAEENIVLLIYLVPVISVITLCVLQITVELMTSSIFGFLFVVGIEVLSCFYTTVLLPGNGAILVRGILVEKRIEPTPYIITCMVICGIAMRIGWISFYKKDLLRRLS